MNVQRAADSKPITVTIVGVGLIGGSLGMAWRAAGSVRHVVGVVRRPEHLEDVVALGACDEATVDLAQGVKDADVVVVCTPVTTIIPTVLALMPHAKPGCIITDAGSTKGHICETLWANSRPDVSFIGGHPMAGSERDGVRAADPYLFQNAVYVLTPHASTDPAHLQLLHTLVQTTGAHTMVMEPHRHDLIVAAVSHVPHLLATSLVQTASQINASYPETLNLAAGGFRDTTRIAAGSPTIWRDICLTNQGAILQVLDRFIQTAQDLKASLSAGDGPALEAYLTEARDVRVRVPNRSKGIITSMHEIVVQVIDRPGEIAAVTQLLAHERLNLIDIEIMRVREGEGGTLRLGFESEDTCDRAIRTLMKNGYTVRKR